MWEASGSVSPNVLTHHIDANRQLTNRISCSDPLYLNDIDALSLTLRSDNTGTLDLSLLIAIVAHLRDDVLTLNIMIANGLYRPQQTTNNAVSSVESSRLRNEDIDPYNAEAAPCVVCMDMPRGPRLPLQTQVNV